MKLLRWLWWALLGCCTSCGGELYLAWYYELGEMDGPQPQYKCKRCGRLC